VGDGAGVDAEEGGGDVRGDAEVVAEAEGQDVVGQVDPAVAVGAFAVPDPVHAPTAAAGAERDLQRGGAISRRAAGSRTVRARWYRAPCGQRPQGGESYKQIRDELSQSSSKSVPL